LGPVCIKMRLKFSATDMLALRSLCEEEMEPRADPFRSQLLVS
jgi:hypothetical protein